MFAVISFIALAVSVILLESSSPMDCITLELFPTEFIDEPIFAIVSLKYSDKSVISSLPVTGRRTVRSPSPWAMFRNASTVTPIGFTIAAAVKNTITSATTKIIAPITYIERRNA